VAALELFLAELRCAARSLRRSPGFALAAMLTLPLGIGANRAFFTLVYGILLRPPFDYREADQLVTLGLNGVRHLNGDLNRTERHT
jgi:putative ABC transport system permease protein